MRRRAAATWAISALVGAVAASSGRAADPLPPVNTAAPTIAANPAPQVGQTLTEVNGMWTPAATMYTYQWNRCDAMGMLCTAVASATAQTYVLTQADVGHTLTVTETAAGAVNPSPPSGPSGVVAPVPAPTVTTAPTISGAAAVAGQTLTEAHGTWTNAPTGYSYQWTDCDGAGNSCVAIPGATGQSYVLGAGDIGHTLRVLETARNAGGSSSPAASGPTGVIPAPPVNTVSPKLSGAGVVGRTLGCTTGGWTGTEPITYTYAWFGDGSQIAGATGPTHTLAITDEAQAIKCVVTATNPAGQASAESDQRLALAAPACYGLSGVGLKKCRARSAYQTARAHCATISAKTGAGRAREKACVARAKLTYHRAVAVARCSQVKSASKRAACVARARKLEK